MSLKFIIISLLFIVFMALTIGLIIKMYMYNVSHYLFLMAPVTIFLSIVILPIYSSKVVLQRISEREIEVNKIYKERLESKFKLSMWFKLKMVFFSCVHIIKSYPNYIDSQAKIFGSRYSKNQVDSLLTDPQKRKSMIMSSNPTIFTEQEFINSRMDTELRNLGINF
ncbi:hypothetical protein T3H97_06435 [Paenibacillus sp. LX16]|uniref:hypothetical protein n=1 Tax=Paenibacillus sp. LX16 TaxID=1740264 RepID=UPI002E2CE058|nr:hypothetical protein [Paenibacillus sp. LX16]